MSTKMRIGTMLLRLSCYCLQIIHWMGGEISVTDEVIRLEFPKNKEG